MIQKNDFILLGLAIASALGIWLLIPSLPQEIPMHWNMEGQIDRFGSHTEFMLLSLLPIALVVLFMVIPFIDPKRANYQKHSKAYGITKYFVTLMMMGISWMTVLFLKGLISHVDTWIILSLAILFIILGNYMPQIRHNYFFGIKTPWTLADETVWKKTHRLGGILFIMVGVALIPLIFINKALTFYVMIGGCILLTLGTAGYSFFLFKKLEKVKMTDKE